MIQNISVKSLKKPAEDKDDTNHIGKIVEEICRRLKMIQSINVDKSKLIGRIIVKDFKSLLYLIKQTILKKINKIVDRTLIKLKVDRTLIKLIDVDRMLIKLMDVDRTLIKLRVDRMLIKLKVDKKLTNVK